MVSLRRDPRRTVQEIWTALSLGGSGLHLDERALDAACDAQGSGKQEGRQLPDDAIPERARDAIRRLDMAQESVRHRHASA